MHYGPTYLAKDHTKPTLSAINGAEIGLSDDLTEVISFSEFFLAKRI